MHQKIGPVGQLRQALAVHGITADGNHLPLCLETIAVAHPALQECRREAEAIAVPDAVGRCLPVAALDHGARGDVLRLDRLPAAERRLAHRPPLPVLVVDLGEQGIDDASRLGRPG